MNAKIGIIGSGNVGKTLAGGFVKHGHEVMLGTRDTSKTDLVKWANESKVKLGNFSDTAKFGEIVVVSTLYRGTENALKLAGPENFKGKVVIDTTNPIADVPPNDGVLTYIVGLNNSAGQEVQKLLPTAHVVKAFNSVGAGFMVNPKFEEGIPTMFICGNDSNSKKTVTDILTKFGWDTQDCGPIQAAASLEALCIIWCSRGFRENQWSHAFKLLKK